MRVLIFDPQTDDVGIFCSTLSEEYFLCAKHFKLSRQEVKQLSEGAVDMIFAGEDEKSRLHAMYKSFDMAI